MATNNLASSSSSMAASSVASHRVRSLWQSFEKTVTTGRTTMEHRAQAAKAKADSDYNKTAPHQRVSLAAHEESKANLVKKIKETYFDNVRGQWQARLQKEGLKDEHWTDVTQNEMERISYILGSEDESDEDMVVIAPPKAVTMPPLQHFYTPTFLQPVAPSMSTSTRASNASSASSYAVVNPNEFHSEEEDYFFQPHAASPHDLTSDEDEATGVTGTNQPVRRRVDPFGTWSSDSLGSSLQNSVDGSAEGPIPRPLASDFAYNTPYGRTSSSKNAPGLQNQKETPAASASKVDVRQQYTGPHLVDTDDTLIEEEEDFERFKMQTRIQKITEFHKAAALAEIHLALEIYKGRKSQAGQKHVVSSLVTDHQKNMVQLQMDKEEERKKIVKTERSKRRSNLRGRPGRSNTIIAPTPSAPANPSWLTALQDDAPEEVESSFDLQQLLADDPDKRATNVEQFLQQMFPAAATASSFSQSMAAQNSKAASFQAAAHDFASQYDPSRQWPSSSMQQNAVAGSSGQGAHSNMHKRRPSDARNKPEAKSFRSSSRPSPFGEDEGGDEEARNSAPETINPFLNADTAALLTNHLQADPDIAQAFAHYTGMTESKNSPPSLPSWSSRLASSQPPSAPSPSPWAAKDVRATPVASGWTRKKPGTATPQPTQASSFKNLFGSADDAEPLPVPSAAAATLSMSTNAKGKRPMVVTEEKQPIWGKQSLAASEDQQPMWTKKAAVALEDQQSMWTKKVTVAPEDQSSLWAKKSTIASEDQQSMWPRKAAPTSENQQPTWARKAMLESEEEQPIWGSPPKNTSPPVPNFSSSKTTATTQVPPVPAKAEKVAPPAPTPAPAPAPSSKKQTKKQRQTNKKGGGAATPAATEEPEPEPEPITAPAASESVAELDSSPLEESNHDTSESMFTIASMARMVPGMSRIRKDSSAASTFSGWESEVATTPRPPAKVPAHLQESMSFKSEGTPRPGLFKKYQTSDSTSGASSLSSPLSQGTIKASQWGAASNTSSTQAKRPLWGMFSNEPTPAKATQPVSDFSPSERDPWVPGGFGANANADDGDDGGGSKDDEDEDEMEETQQFWKPAGAKTTSVPAQPQQLSAAQRLRRVAEPAAAPVAPPAPRTDAVKAIAAATQPQNIPASANSKKARGKKNAKGKKTSIEDVPDEEEVSRGESLPVDSKVILEDSQPILGPKPSVPPVLYDSIISYTDDDEEEEAMFSSFAPTPSTAASTPPDLFGDEARMAAAVKEMQETALKMAKLHGDSGSAASGAKRPLWPTSGVETDSQNSSFSFGARATSAAKSTVSQAPAWGQSNNTDKGKGKMTDSNGGDEPTKVGNTTIKNLKRSKAAGGKLF